MYATKHRNMRIGYFVLKGPSYLAGLSEKQFLSSFSNFMISLKYSAGLLRLLISAAWSDFLTYLLHWSYLEFFWETRTCVDLRWDRTIQNLIKAERYSRSAILFLRSLVVKFVPLSTPDSVMNAQTLKTKVNSCLYDDNNFCFLYF